MGPHSARAGGRSAMSAGPQGRQPLRPAPGASPSWRGPRRRLGDPSAGGTAGQERGITVIDAGSGGAAGSDVRRGRRAVRAGAAGLSVAAVRRPGGAGRVRNRLEEVLKLLRPRRFRPGRGPYNATDPTVSGSGDDDGPTNTVERVPGAGGGSGSDGHRLRRHGTCSPDSPTSSTPTPSQPLRYTPVTFSPLAGSPRPKPQSTAPR